MSVAFTRERWAKVREDARQWWAGELTRPLIQIYMPRESDRQPAKLPCFAKDVNAYDLRVTVDDIIDRVDYELSCQQFLGDAFPTLWPDFGPGVIGAFLGGQVETGAGTVWFHPGRPTPITDLQLTYDPHNVWFERVKAISRAGIERWDGLVQVCMTDLGGNLDILATFRPSEELLFDLYDEPEDVKRVTWEAHELWWRYFDELNALLQPINPGYSAWTPLFSETPYYMLQCDFAYMISPEMFDEFVKPELVASCRRLDHAFYHLDGIGQLPHLDSLLAIEELKGVQWIPGDGQPDCTHWPDVYRKIRDAGKLIQVGGDLGTLGAIAEQLGTAEGIAFIAFLQPSEYNDAMALLQKYDVID